MQIITSYNIRISEHGKVLRDTVEVYRKAVDYFISVINLHWGNEFQKNMGNKACTVTERLCICTKKRPITKFDFSKEFYKFPVYLRRSAIMEAYGAVSSYHSRLELWKKSQSGKAPGFPKAGRTFPVLYRDNMFVRNGRYCARIKVFVRNTWDWIDIGLRKTDVDYIALHCATRKEMCPTLRSRGKVWSLDFSFKEEVKLTDKKVDDRIVLGVDLGLNNACVCSVMRSDGTILGRYFLNLPREKDSLERALGRIRKAQKLGARKMPRLWAYAKGINDAIAVKTANFIISVATKNAVDVIVMEKLNLSGKKRGSKKQRLHHWRAQYVQRMVEGKAHRNQMRFSHVCAWNTSGLAFDGSGKISRDKKNFSLCTFESGKQYHSDLNATYNIGARYFIRETLKTLSVTARQHIEAKVPECAHRSTSTLCSLIRLHAELGLCI